MRRLQVTSTSSEDINKELGQRPKRKNNEHIVGIQGMMSTEVATIFFSTKTPNDTSLLLLNLKLQEVINLFEVKNKRSPNEQSRTSD